MMRRMSGSGPASETMNGKLPSTVEAKGEDERELLRLTATVPFDDRQCPAAELDDLKPRLITSFLKEIRSELARQATRLSLRELARRMNLIEGAEEHARPRNVGLLFFNDEPTRFLPGAHIDVVLFPAGPGGRELIEKTFRGPLHEQVRDALRYIQNSTLRESVIKRTDRAEATRAVNWPFSAIEEALVNAVYHRSYELADPVEVRINPDVIEIVSYPGPDPSIRIEALNKDRVIARRYRNRRIGEFLKELDLTEGRSTGIPRIHAAMSQNGSPPPRFSTDAGRTYFLVELPVHPALPGVKKAHDEAHDEAHDALSQTEKNILRALISDARSRADIAAVLGVRSRSGALYKSLDRLREAGLIEFTIPDKRQSRFQKLRLTPVGRARLAAVKTRARKRR